MIKPQNVAAHLRSIFRIRRHFRNPWLIVLMRLGLIKIPYFFYRISKDGWSLDMLARPSQTAMGDFFVLKEVLMDETYRDILPLLKKKDIRFVDIGGNIGSFTLWIHRVIGIQEAFCFEPEPDSFRLLNFNLSRNDCPAAKPLQCAVGGEARNIKIVLKHENPAATSIYDDTSLLDNAVAVTVPVVTLEDWLRGVDGDFDLLKIDCEGAEWEIMRKTSSHIFAHFRVLVAEIHEDPANKQAISEFKNMVEKHGYRTVRWDNRSQGLYVGIRDS